MTFQGRPSIPVSGSVDSKAKPKASVIYADPTNPRCMVPMYETYLRAIGYAGRFYR